MDIQLGVDNTDHLAFFCPHCKAVMKVTKVQTERAIVNTRAGKHDKCTWIHCACPKHGNVGWRKFYWTVEDGQYCDARTTVNTKTPTTNDAWDAFEHMNYKTTMKHEDKYYEAVRLGVGDGIERLACRGSQMPGADFYVAIQEAVKLAVERMDLHEAVMEATRAHLDICADKPESLISEALPNSHLCTPAEVEAIRAVHRLEDVVGQFVTLTHREPGIAIGLCPFHKEATPSFHVYVDERYICFGCHKSGDVFQFVQDQLGVDFAGAVKWLRQRKAKPCWAKQKESHEDTNRGKSNAAVVGGQKDTV